MKKLGDMFIYSLLLSFAVLIFGASAIGNIEVNKVKENVSAKVVRSELPPLPTELLNELPPIPEVALKEYKPTEVKKQEVIKKEEEVTITRKRRGYYGGTSRAAKSYGQTMFERNR
jgi:PBP1b-binding outer membrane lipoprotein LpoB